MVIIFCPVDTFAVFADQHAVSFMYKTTNRGKIKMAKFFVGEWNWVNSILILSAD